MGLFSGLKALQEESKYSFLNSPEQNNGIEKFLEDNMQTLTDEKTLKILSDPVCLKSLTTITELPVDKRNTFYELIGVVGDKPEKLDLILGLLK
ncbi:MAG: hypothetical protein HRT90_03425 [Candidatus Margulisbacteria bacterium]|nr:hypothetical protein [Candidatus Margulisiibacteriota bacterium]